MMSRLIDKKIMNKASSFFFFTDDFRSTDDFKRRWKRELLMNQDNDVTGY